MMKLAEYDQMGRTCVVHRGLKLCIQRSAGAVTLIASRADAHTGEHALRIRLGEGGLADDSLLKQVAKLGDMFHGERNI